MATGRENLAYDFARFEQRKPAVRVVEEPKQQAVPAAKAAGTAKIVLTGVLVVAIMCLMIYSRVVLTETNEKVNALSGQLAELQNEQTRLEMEVESMASLSKVEEYATQNLGLEKLENHQVGYISLSEEDKVALSQKDQGFAPFKQIEKLFDSIKEYLGW